MLGLLGFAAGFGLIYWLGTKRPEVRKIGGGVFAVLGVVAALSGAMILGLCLIVAGLGLSLGRPLGNRGNHRS